MNRRSLLLAPLLALATCGPPPPPPTVLDATIAATPEANGGADGKGAPVSLRVYQLASPAGFDAAQFFPLFNNDAALLKEDIVKRDDILLAPGQSKTLTLSPPDRAKSIGVFAAYRDYEHVTWHATAAIPANKTSKLTITAAGPGVKIAIEPAK